jgi:translation initiation factor IF-3
VSKNKKNLNNDIRANKVQLITDDGENLGEMTLAEAKVI